MSWRRGAFGRALALVLAVAVAGVASAGCSKGKTGATGAASAATAEVGRVTAVSGDVQARRGGATRVLKVGDAVFGDDVLTTGVGASVALKLVSGAVYELGAEKTRPLAEVVAQLGGLGGGAGGEADVTAAAGRHAEESAADTSATAPTGPETEAETDDEAGGSGTRMQGEEGRMGKASTGKGAPGSGAPPDPDSFGEGGLGMSGTGAGGGGRGDGIGLGGIGTIGHGSGTGSGQGFGSGNGRLGGSSAAPAAKVEVRKPTVKGGLPAEVVQRILRRNLGRWRLCYENALKTISTPKPARVELQFVIDTKGAVVGPVVGAGALPEVASCIRGSLTGLQFPPPSGGRVVTVSAALQLTPP